jgi:hypothetical protein
LNRQVAALEAALAETQADRDNYKKLAHIGRWHNDCRPNRVQALQMIENAQATIDKMADAVAEANRKAESIERDTYAKARAAVEAKRDMTKFLANVEYHDGMVAGYDAALEALDALAAPETTR